MTLLQLIQAAPGIEKLPLPLGELKEVSWLHSLLAYPPLKAIMPFPLLMIIGLALYWFFKKTWRELEQQTAYERAALAVNGSVRSGPSRYLGRYRLSRARAEPSVTLDRPEQDSIQHWWRLRRKLGAWSKRQRSWFAQRFATPDGKLDYRPAACLVLAAAILTIQEYYGGRSFYERVLKPELLALDAAGFTWLQVKKYQGLYSYGWWTTARVVGYVVLPVIAWKLWFPKDNMLDYGLRIKGFIEHLWIYGLLLAIVVPAMLVVAQQPDFGNYYPFYKQSSRSWFDFLTWEALYYGQFFALEFFFRGWMIGALRRSLGVGAIFVMSVPYCMIHYGKPYLEAHGAIVAGVVLGTLSMKTRSVYAGFLLHITVAAGMDFLSLYKRNALPTAFWPE